MRKKIFQFVTTLLIVPGIMSCSGPNLYTSLAANKESDAALFEDAQKLLDEGDYTGAINKILETSASFQEKARTKESLAGAYAARCGMEFLTFTSNLTSASSDSLFKLAMNGFVGIDTANYDDCKTARTIVQSIGTIGERTQSQNLFLMILDLAMLGNRIRSVADISPATGDGVVDGTFDCMDSVPIADAREVMDNFIDFLTQFSEVGSVLGSGGATGGIDTFIEDYGIPAADYTQGTDATAPDEMDPAIIMARSLINMQSIGVGSCNDPDPSNCVCPP